MMRFILITILCFSSLKVFSQQNDSIPEYDEDTALAYRSSFGLNIGCTGLFQTNDYFIPSLTWSNKHWLFMGGVKLYLRQTRGFVQYGFDASTWYIFGKHEAVFRPYVFTYFDQSHYFASYITGIGVIENGMTVNYNANIFEKHNYMMLYAGPGFRLKIAGGFYLNFGVGYGWKSESNLKTTTCAANPSLNKEESVKMFANIDRGLRVNFGFGFDVNY